MDCTKSQNLMSLYIDNKLENDEKMIFENHISSCKSCKEELDLLNMIIGNVNELNEEKELPEDFHTNLMVKIDNINKAKNHKADRLSKIKNMRKYYTAVAAVFVAVLIFSFIGISNLDKYNTKGDNNTAKKYTQLADKEVENITESKKIDIHESDKDSDVSYSLLQDDSSNDMGESVSKFKSKDYNKEDFIIMNENDNSEEVTSENKFSGRALPSNDKSSKRLTKESQVKSTEIKEEPKETKDKITLTNKKLKEDTNQTKNIENNKTHNNINYILIVGFVVLTLLIIILILFTKIIKK
ncbi:MAG: zf-HC2 domain-containing protein [Vallitalea sp.]|jgi:uncharacterized integral membrane protein|nr:zf-HC2 domain-containing protein [Vallitalea sp.]